MLYVPFSVFLKKILNEFLHVDKIFKKYSFKAGNAQNYENTQQQTSYIKCNEKNIVVKNHKNPSYVFIK